MMKNDIEKQILDIINQKNCGEVVKEEVVSKTGINVKRIEIITRTMRDKGKIIIIMRDELECYSINTDPLWWLREIF